MAPITIFDVGGSIYTSTNVSDSQFYLVCNGQSQIYVKSDCIDPLTLFDKGYSYLTMIA